jgi:hypothetical protein
MSATQSPHRSRSWWAAGLHNHFFGHFPHLVPSFFRSLSPHPSSLLYALTTKVCDSSSEMNLQPAGLA